MSGRSALFKVGVLRGNDVISRQAYTRKFKIEEEEHMNNVLPYADIVVGNEGEAETFAQVSEWGAISMSEAGLWSCESAMASPSWHSTARESPALATKS